MRTAIIILGHGSKSTIAADGAIRRTAEEVRKLGEYDIVEYAFLQYAVPEPHEVLKNCISQKAERVVIVPFFMQRGAHVTRDIPAFVSEAKNRYPGVEFAVTDFVGAHPLMAKIVLDLVNRENN